MIDFFTPVIERPRGSPAAASATASCSCQRRCSRTIVVVFLSSSRPVDVLKNERHSAAASSCQKSVAAVAVVVVVVVVAIDGGGGLRWWGDIFEGDISRVDHRKSVQKYRYDSLSITVAGVMSDTYSTAVATIVQKQNYPRIHPLVESVPHHSTLEKVAQKWSVTCLHTSPWASARDSLAAPAPVALRRSTSAGARPPADCTSRFVAVASARRQGSPSSKAMVRASSCLLINRARLTCITHFSNRHLLTFFVSYPHKHTHTHRNG